MFLAIKLGKHGLIKIRRGDAIEKHSKNYILSQFLQKLLGLEIDIWNKLLFSI